VGKQTGKGSRHQRRASAIERKATKHQQFVGDAAPDRAEAEFRKHDHLEAEENREVVREMAHELEAAAGLKHDGAIGPEFPLRIPRSIQDVKEIARDAPEALREKARERLEKLPEPAQKAMQWAGSTAGLLVGSVRFGLHLAQEVLRLPLSVLRTLRQREA
jgi:hypothetical protein